MQKFKDHSCFEQFIRAQVDEIRRYRTALEDAIHGTDQSTVARWIADHAQAFRESYMVQHPDDLID